VTPSLTLEVGSFVACKRTGDERRLDHKGRPLQGVIVSIIPGWVNGDTGEQAPDRVCLASAFGPAAELKDHCVPDTSIDHEHTDPPMPMHVEEIVRRLLIASRYREARQLLISIEQYSR
jgi:hypothetical protein